MANRGARSPALTLAHQLRRVWWRVFGPRTVGVRGVVLDSEGSVLLVRHTYGQPRWHLPGGGVKRREGIAAACLRELLEEVGVEVEGGASGLDLFGTYSNLTEGKSDHVTVFVVRGWTQVEPNSGEIAEARFVPLDHLPDDVSPGTARRLAELRAGQQSSFVW